MAASSSAKTWAFKPSSMPLLCDSNFADDAAVPNDELVEERAETPLFTFFWLLLFSFHVSSFSYGIPFVVVVVVCYVLSVNLFEIKCERMMKDNHTRNIAQTIIKCELCRKILPSINVQRVQIYY